MSAVETKEGLLTFDVGVDIDDVLHPWYDTAHQLAVAAGITNGVTPTTWRMATEYGCDLDVWVSVLEEATWKGTLYGVPPIPGRVEALRRLLFDGHRIHLVTARGTAAWTTPEQRFEIQQQTKIWIEEFAVPHDTLTFESDKPSVALRLDLDYFIDDGVHNFQDLEQLAETCETYLMTAPHNESFYTPFRLNSMDEFVDVVTGAATRGLVKP